MNHISRFYVLEDDYLVGHGPTEVAALEHADRTVADENRKDGSLDAAIVPRVTFEVIATEAGHKAVLVGFSPAVEMS